MAIEKRQILGEVTGTLGDIVRRKRYGKIVVSRRPSKYRKSKSKEAVEGRTSFALSVAFAKTVNSIPALKQIWQIAKLEGVVAYNRIIKYNKQYISDSSLTFQNIITPNGHNIIFPVFSLLEMKFQITIEANAEPLLSFIKQPFYLHIIIYAFNPKVNMKRPFEVIGISSIVDQHPANDIYSIEIDVDRAKQRVLNQFNNVICFAALSKTEGNKSEIFWTETVSKQFHLG